MRKRIFSVILTVVMVMAMCAQTFASTPPTPSIDNNGEQGAFTTPDTPVSQSKTLYLAKELRAYNAVDNITVNAPDISYTYTIAPATVSNGTTVTDAADKHDPSGSVVATVKAGITGATVTGTVSWSPSETITAGTNGVANTKAFGIDFSGVVFTGAGVYRYVLTESLTEGYTFATSGVTDTELADTRYIDVYVRPNPDGMTNNGLDADDWDIYGYTCFFNNETFTDENKGTVAVKTTGFVSKTDPSTGDVITPADKYYTYNVTVSKTVVGDAYGALTAEYPFTVVFTNNTITRQVHIIATPNISNKVGGSFDPGLAAFTDNEIGVVALIMDGGSVKYIGIPAGTTTQVYETNNQTGVTYKVQTVVDSDATTSDSGVTSGSAPASAVVQQNKAAYESTMVTIATTADQADAVDHTVAVTNTFENISPTGVMLRFAPYLMILFAGGLLIMFCVLLFKRNRREEEAVY